jgi:hypothetical protein
MLRKLLFGLAIATMLAGTALFADVLLNKKHKGLNGRDGDKVNCVYCHTKAGNPKVGKDYEKYKSGPYCKIKGCH